MKQGFSRVLRWIYPPTCVLCGREGGGTLDICLDCERLLPRIMHGCIQCGSVLPTPVSKVEAEVGYRLRCGRCLRKPPPFECTLGALQYAEPVSWLVQHMKFNGNLVYARLLSSLWLKYQTENALRRRPDWIIPVPLHPARLRERGFNQALALARPIAAALDIPLSLVHCGRVVDTPGQTGLSAKRRAANVRRAFVLHQALPARRVALLDDVMTTGSTVAALAALLKRSGVAEVDVWIVARASRKVA